MASVSTEAQDGVRLKGGRTIYPVLFRIGEFEITSFGVLVAIGVAVGLVVFRRELRRSRLPANAIEAGLFGVAAGYVGAKLLWVLEHLGEAPLPELLFSRGGMSWFGGFAGGVLIAWWWLNRSRLPITGVVAAATPALALGHALGRIGCFLVGDDYGKPSNLPWAVAFPEGLPPTLDRVHPTQLYEMLGLLPIAWLLVHWRRTGRSDRFVVGAYLALTGSLRFLIEFIRVDKQVLPGITIAHVASTAVVISGVTLIRLSQRTPRGARIE